MASGTIDNFFEKLPKGTVNIPISWRDDCVPPKKKKHGPGRPRKTQEQKPDTITLNTDSVACYFDNNNTASSYEEVAFL